MVQLPRLGAARVQMTLQTFIERMKGVNVQLEAARHPPMVIEELIGAPAAQALHSAAA